MPGRPARPGRPASHALAVGMTSVLLAACTALGVPPHQASAEASAAAAAIDCTILVPANPLTATGLATPYQLAGARGAATCHEASLDQAAFVQAAALDPATGRVSIYNPLVVDAGTAPAAKPVMPKLPAGAIVAIWFGSNGNVLQLHRTHLHLERQDGKPLTSADSATCVNGTTGTNGSDGSDFGQVAYCNAPAFFEAANRAHAEGMLDAPALGTAKDGLPCPSTRDFSIVDQDPSDNVTASYLVLPNGQTAQNTAVNRARLAGATVLSNGSDEGLLAAHVDPALGCAPWMAPDLADPGAQVPALPLNELQAAAHQAVPVALVPELDPMVLDASGAPSLAKQNLYRVGVDQPKEPSTKQADADEATFCRHIEVIAPARLAKDQAYLQAAASPVAGYANLDDFLQARYAFTISALGLNCAASVP